MKANALVALGHDAAAQYPEHFAQWPLGVLQRDIPGHVNILQTVAL